MMATNFTHSHNGTNEPDDDSQRMDDEKSSITEERGPNLPTLQPHFAGPMNLFLGIYYINLNHKNTMAKERIAVNVDEILLPLSTNSADFNNPLVQLQELAKESVLNLYICIMNENKKEFYYLNATSEQGDLQWPRAYLVLDERNQNCYIFCVYDDQRKRHTKFSTTDTHIMRLFEDLVYSNWPVYFQTINQLPDQDIQMLDEQNDEETNAAITNVNHHTENADHQSETLLKTSATDLLAQQAQSLITCVGPLLDHLKLPFKSSEYQLRINQLTSVTAIFEGLGIQIQMLSKILTVVDEYLKNNRTTQTSMLITEATAINRDALTLTNHQQDILPNDQMVTESALPCNSQLTTATNTDPNSPLITTNKFNESIKLSKVELLNQAARKRKRRRLEDLRGNNCPAIQVEGAKQGAPLEFKLPNEINNYTQEFYLGAHAVTYDKREHDQRLVVPTNISIKKGFNLKANDLSGLIVLKTGNNGDDFDPKTKGAYSKITKDELKNLYKEWTFKIVNFYKDKNITTELINNKKLKWCRLMYAIYIKSDNDQFERVSPPIFSDLIEDTDGAQSVEVDTIFPVRYCKNGGQMCYIALDAPAEKEKIHVRCNEKDFGKNIFQISGKILSFETSACKDDRNNLDIIIYNQNTNHLTFFTPPYHPHDNHLDPCGAIDED